MNHTPQIRKAIHFAARKHHGHLRISSEPDKPLPYIVHLFSVALLVAEDGSGDDVVAAALLHDTIEDTQTTREEIAEAFNDRVAALVESVTEVGERDGERLPWREVRQNYLDRVRESSDDSVRIMLADKVDNVESRIEEYNTGGKAIFGRWRQPNEEYLWFYGEALALAEERLPDHALTKRYAEVLTHLRTLTA